VGEYIAPQVDSSLVDDGQPAIERSPMKRLLLSVVMLASMAALPGLGGCGKANPGAANKPMIDKDAVTNLGSRRRLSIDVEAELQKARESLSKGDPLKAIKALYPVVNEVPENLDVRVLIATAYSSANKHAKALEHAKAGLRIDPRAKGAILAKGVALAGMGRVQEGVQEIREVTRRDPRHKGAWLNLARFHGLLKQWDKQEIALDKLIALEPDVIGHRVARAKALARLEKLEPARKVLEAAVQRVPHDADAQLLLAAVLYEQGKLSDAMDRADIAARLDPEKAQAFDLFRASFYVAVSSRLQCKLGDPPWAKDRVDKMLELYKRQGIDNVEEFYEIHASYGATKETKARIARLAQRCREEGSKLPTK